MAAIAMSLAMGVPLSTILSVIRDFKAVEHRIEFVATKRGVDYYNDSKGTNPDAAIQALNAMPGPTILIGGGYDKKNTYDEWARLFPGKVRQLVLLGQTAKDIAACCRKYGFDSIVFADSMEEAVRISASYAQEGDSVLLSPACASWGMFKDFEERGRIFKDCVNAL
jgi:UDP-N-acetylmuramoylalanine--D-glutamate ligase